MSRARKFRKIKVTMKFTLGTATVLVLAALVSTGSARPEGSAETATSTSTSTSTSTIANGEDVGTTTAVPEESKMSKFFDDVSSAFKSGTAKVKESFESAATSVKDGVLRGYGFVKDKLTGTADPTAAPGNETETSSTAATTSTVAVTPTTKLVSARSITGNSATAKAIGVEPNDEETKDEDRLIFIGDEDTATDAVVPTTTVAAAGASSTVKTKLDDRWIIDGPTACKSGQAVVNGKCKNVF